MIEPFVIHMTVETGNRVDIVRALKVGEGGIHRAHINPAVGGARMAIYTGVHRIIGVRLMAGVAAEPFMYTHGSSTIVRASLVGNIG